MYVWNAAPLQQNLTPGLSWTLKTIGICLNEYIVGRPVKTSASYPGYPASAAVDGNTAVPSSAFFISGSSRTPWIQVELESAFRVTAVKVLSRPDACCPGA